MCDGDSYKGNWGVGVNLSTGNAKSKLCDRGDDLYETPPEAVESLLCTESLPHRIWEPACGPGAIARILRLHGHSVFASDLVDYQSEDQDAARCDFLMYRKPPDEFQAIVTNPPFKLAGEFVAKALDLCPLVIMLLRLAFMESEKRTPILDNGKLARVHVYRKRLPMMHRAGWEGRKANSGMAFAWFIWDADHSGPTELQRISWDR
jgi:hypothetical protein